MPPMRFRGAVAPELRQRTRVDPRRASKPRPPPKVRRGERQPDLSDANLHCGWPQQAALGPPPPVRPFVQLVAHGYAVATIDSPIPRRTRSPEQFLGVAPPAPFHPRPSTPA